MPNKPERANRRKPLSFRDRVGEITATNFMAKHIWRVMLVGVPVAIGILAFVTARPSALPGKFPSGFSDVEKREISTLAHSDALHQSFKSLTHGQFARAWRWVRTAQRQRVWAIGNQPDGQIWVHMGIEDKSQPDGYGLSARYMMKKQNGHWKITTMF